jgi:hypothetical protein
MSWLTTGAAITVPESAAGSSFWMVRITASIAGYSVAWTPAVRPSVGPRRVPVISTIGIRIGPPGLSPTVMKPRTFLPGSPLISRIWITSVVTTASSSALRPVRPLAAGHQLSLTPRRLS